MGEDGASITAHTDRLSRRLINRAEGKRPRARVRSLCGCAALSGVCADVRARKKLLEVEENKKKTGHEVRTDRFCSLKVYPTVGHVTGCLRRFINKVWCVCPIWIPTLPLRSGDVDAGNQLSAIIKQRRQIPLDKDSHKLPYLRGPGSSVIYYLQHV